MMARGARTDDAQARGSTLPSRKTVEESAVKRHRIS